MSEDKISKNCVEQKTESEKEIIGLYHYWREVQRKQLGDSANLYMIFSSAILGYVVNFLVTKRNISCNEKVLLTIAVIFLLISLLFYGLLVFNRLYDFRKTARLYDEGKSEHIVGKLTRRIGKCSWWLFYIQIGWLFFGFIFSLIGFCFYIYS